MVRHPFYFPASTVLLVLTGLIIGSMALLADLIVRSPRRRRRGDVRASPSSRTSISGAEVRIALVGPTHPYKGGVAVHTTGAAHRLAAAGHDVDLVSWARLYPSPAVPGRADRARRRPGACRPTRARSGCCAGTPPAPGGGPGAGCAGTTLWSSWSRWSRRTPRRCSRWPARPPRGAGPGVVLAHNVVPHETHPGGRLADGPAAAPRPTPCFVHSLRAGRPGLRARRGPGRGGRPAAAPARRLPRTGGSRPRSASAPWPGPGRPPGSGCSRWGWSATTRASTCCSRRPARCRAST